MKEWKRAKASWKDQLKNGDLDLSSINQYIKEMIQDSLSEHIGYEEKKDNERRDIVEPEEKSLKYSVFQIIGCTIVQIILPENVDYKTINIGIDHRELLINIDSNLSEIILLPVKAREDTCKAFCRDNILEVRIPHDPNKTYIDVPIIPV